MKLRSGQRAFRRCVAATAVLLFASSVAAQVAVKAEKLHTMGPVGTIDNAVVVITDGKIAATGPAADVVIPNGYRVLEAKIVTPGLIDAHATVGLTGIYNSPHDSDQLESSSPIQPELRAIDAYNPNEKLVAYVRSFGITTVHTGHAPGEAISGQTIIVKTVGNSVEEALVKPLGAVACTLGPSAQKRGGKSPGTRAKLIAMLRAELIKAQEYDAKVQKAAEGKQPDRNLRLEALAAVLRGETPMLITAHRAQDIEAAMRLQEEFGFKLILDGAAEASMLAERLKERNIPVIVHPSMMRAYDEAENASFTTASKLRQAGVRIAMQSGYEGYVPKTRIVLFEAALTAANGLSFEQALATITIDAATMLEIESRVGSIEVGKDGDVALFDGDPFEYTTHCVGVVIDGKVVSEVVR